MTNIIIGCLLLITFVGFIVFVMRGGNVMIGFLAMALLWTVIGGIPYKVAITDIFSQPAMDYGSTIMVIVFGSWFGRVLVDTGIASAISAQTVKVSRKRPVLATILICLVTAFIFTSSYGVGAVIAIGVILLPILQSLGLSKNVAVSAFVLSIGAPMYVNIVIIKQLQLFFPKVIYSAKYLKFGFSAMAVQMVVVIIFILLHAKSIRKNDDVQEVADDTPKVPKISYILPIFPVFMNLVFQWEPIPALMLAIFLVLLTTGHLKSYQSALKIINDTISKAITDISGLIIMLLFLTMFSAAAVKITARFSSLLTGIVPHSPLVIALIFGICAPLALFRGPLMFSGAGAATAAVLAGTGFFNQYFGFAIILVPTVSIAISTCITQSWNLWVVEHEKLDVKQSLWTGVPFGWVTSIINLLLAVVMFK